MNANTIITDDMSLDEKLAAIDQMVANAQPKVVNGIKVPVDPAEATMCLGCS